MESSLPVAQIDFSQPSTSIEEEGNRNEENEEAFSSDLAAIAVSEGEEIERKLLRTPSAKPSSLTTCFSQADIKPQIRISLTLTIKFAFTLGYHHEVLMVVFEHISLIAQQISRVHHCTYETKTKCTVEDLKLLVV